MYTIIYDWFTTLFDNNQLTTFTLTIMNTQTNLQEWLCHTATIIVLVACCLFLFTCVRYLFRVGASLFRW